MSRTTIATLASICFLTAALLGQSGPAQAAANSQGATSNVPVSEQGQPVSYASVSQLNGMLSALETTSKSTQGDLVKLRIEHWKTDGNSKKQALSNVDSIERNLQGALPEIITKLRSSPEDVPSTFKLYRNLDALYDVLGNVVELAGAFGSKDDVQALSNDLSSFENTRKELAERIENLSTSKEAELVRLRADLKTAQAAIPAEPPKKIVVDDNEPPKKPVAKKPASKTKSTPGTTKPPTGQTKTPPPQQNPSAQQPNPPAQPQ